MQSFANEPSIVPVAWFGVWSDPEKRPVAGLNVPFESLVLAMVSVMPPAEVVCSWSVAMPPSLPAYGVTAVQGAQPVSELHDRVRVP
ncbi:MAG: hypothetical protein WDN08_04840 [Rhizomicrobium sp.]